MDEQCTKVNSENEIFKKEIIELKETNIKLQNKIDELEQYRKCSCTRIDGKPEVSNESSENVFNYAVDVCKSWY